MRIVRNPNPNLFRDSIRIRISNPLKKISGFGIDNRIHSEDLIRIRFDTLHKIRDSIRHFESWNEILFEISSPETRFEKHENWKSLWLKVEQQHFSFFDMFIISCTSYLYCQFVGVDHLLIALSHFNCSWVAITNYQVNRCFALLRCAEGYKQRFDMNWGTEFNTLL